MVQSMSDPKSCVFDQANCEYSVGAVESSQRERLCLQKPYSEERLVPEYEIADTNVDWRVWGVVRPSKDQGKCGGDFAFSTAASAESQFAIKTGKLYDLSE
jgi:C1A family cysteine protease